LFDPSLKFVLDSSKGKIGARADPCEGGQHP